MDRIGRYETVRPIGSGGMADVWLARLAHGAATKTVAIKVIAEHLADSEEFQRLFAAEVRTSMLMSHSCIAQVFDVGVHKGRSFLVMEWIDGLDLHRVLSLLRQRGLPMAAELAAFVTAGILRALSYAHTLTHEAHPLGIVHRDISPHNVLLSVSGEVKLVDFGIAALATDHSRQRDVRGKLKYMPPEQLEGRSKDPRVDIFSTGAILHEMLGGAPFRGDASTTELFAWVAEGRVPPLPPTIPPALARVCLRMLARDPDDRYASAREALQDLRAWKDFSGSDLEMAELCRAIMGIAAPRTGNAAPGATANTNAPSREKTQDATGDATTATRSSALNLPPRTKRSRWPLVAGIGGALVLTGALGAAIAGRGTEPASNPELALPRPPEYDAPAAVAQPDSDAKPTELPPPRPETAVSAPTPDPVESPAPIEPIDRAAGDTEPGAAIPQAHAGSSAPVPEVTPPPEVTAPTDPTPQPRRRRTRQPPAPAPAVNAPKPKSPPPGPTLPFNPGR